MKKYEEITNCTRMTSVDYVIEQKKKKKVDMAKETSKVGKF